MDQVVFLVSIYHACLSQFGSVVVSSLFLHSRNPHTLYKCRQHFTARLQQWVSHDNLQEALKTFPPVLNHIVGEAICEHLAGQRRYSDARRFSLEYVAEGFEVAIAPAHRGRLELEGGDVCSHYDFVGGVHAAADAYESLVSDIATLS